MTQLRVLCGTSRDNLTVVPVNHDVSSPVSVSSDLFEGKISVRIRDFSGDSGKDKERLTTTESEYFEQHPRLTWSMAIQGHFKEEVNADDVLYGNIFDKPIRDHLPYGTSAALRFINYVDPSLEQDIYGDKPWALSPLVATMNHMRATKMTGEKPEWRATQPEDDASALDESSDELSGTRGDAAARKAYFAQASHRKAITIKPEHWLELDFCNGYISFNDFSLKLPGGLHFSLLRYWDGQPVTYVCRSRDGSKAYFYIVFEIIDQSVAPPTDSQQEANQAKSDVDDID